MSHRKPGSWKKDAVNAAEFDAWDRASTCRLGNDHRHDCKGGGMSRHFL